MVRIGITGGIGSGKSYVSQLLKERGIPVYDSDREAKRLMCTDETIREGLVELLGKEVYLPDGGLNKSMVAHYLFAKADNAIRINALVHPVVEADFRHWVCKHVEKAVVALESAILFESGFDDVVDFVVMVYAPVEVRMHRVLERDTTTKEQVRRRMAAQLDDRIKCIRSDYVIVNDGIRALPPQLDNLQKTLEKKEKGNS